MRDKSFIKTGLVFAGLLFQRGGWALTPVELTDVDELSHLSLSLKPFPHLAVISHTACLTLQSRPSVAWAGDTW